MSALNVSTANATTEQLTSAQTSPTIESRLSRITDAMKQREIQQPEASERLSLPGSSPKSALADSKSATWQLVTASLSLGLIGVEN